MKAKDYVNTPTDRDEIDLQKYWQILKRRWPYIVSVSGLTTALAVAAVSLKSPIYKADAQLLFESNKTSSLIGLDGAKREIRPLSFQDNPLDTQVQIIRSIPVVQQVIEELQIKDSKGELIKPASFRANLTVKGVPGTDVLDISYTSPDPELAAMAVNTIMDIYIQNDVQVNRAAATAAQEFILEQLPDTEAAVVEAESQLSAFKELYDIVDLDEESRSTVEGLAILERSLTDLNADLAESKAKALEIQERLKLTPQEAYAVALVSESPGVQETLSQLQDVQSNLSIELARYQEGHPTIAILRRQENRLNSLLQQRVRDALGENQAALPANDLQAGQLEQRLISEYLLLTDELSGIEQRIGELTNSQGSQQERARIIPSLEKQQRQLERELDAAQVTYETLLQNLQEARVLENQNLGNSRIVSPALIPENSVAPSTKLYVATGAMLGILFGISLAFLVDLLDRSAKTVHEGQEVYEYPLLGVIPAWRKLPRFGHQAKNIPALLVNNPESMHMIEAYRSLQANLKFATLSNSLKAIMVTSSVAGEGKSEIVANLAWTLSQLDHKVLIIDANMRDPSQHEIWNIPNLEGFSDVVAGHSSLKQAIKYYESRLHILPAGDLPTNPLAILESHKIKHTLHQCKKIYDYIIVDSSPISGLTDALTLGRNADATLLVMQPGLVDIDSINSTKTKLSQSHQKVLGLVANGIKAKSNPDHYYYYNQEYFTPHMLNHLPEVSNSLSKTQ